MLTMLHKETSTESNNGEISQLNSIEENNGGGPVVIQSSTKPPSYARAMRTQPPPPSYIQSTTRLYYNNQPFIQDDQFMFCHQCQFNRYVHHDLESRDSNNYHDHSSDTDSVMPTTVGGKVKFCANSWISTIREAKLVFFAFFFIFSLIVLGLVIPFVRMPQMTATT